MTTLSSVPLISLAEQQAMELALAMAAQGEGLVEPNPMVGCVLLNDGEVVGQGWHRQFGQDHAERVALNEAKHRAEGATALVTLEPCCHTGKTPPCAEALVQAKVARVIVARRDPNPKVSGAGIARLRDAGVEVVVLQEGPLADAAQRLLAPFEKLMTTGKPWVIAKWAMSLDGRIATSSGESKWISNDASREMVQQLRGRVDAVVVGRETAAADNPMLTARPANGEDIHRNATRVVLSRGATLRSDSQLVATADLAPVLEVCHAEALRDTFKCKQDCGVEVLQLDWQTPAERVEMMLQAFGRRDWTNVLFEGGGRVLGSLFDQQAVDEVHVFVAPKIIGGAGTLSPIMGDGIDQMSHALRLDGSTMETLEGDIYFRGRVTKTD